MIEQPEYAAEAILTFMQNVQPKSDIMSNTTARNIDRILVYCKEQDICPWIVLVYGDDLSKFSRLSFTRPEDMTEARMCYVWGEKEPNLSALEKAWGDSVESTTVQELNTLQAPEIEKMSLYELETEKPEIYAEVKNGLMKPAENTAFLDLLATSGSETGNPQVYDWRPDEECMVEKDTIIDAVYYRKDKQAIADFEQYVAQVKDKLQIETKDGEYSLSVPLSEKCTSEVQVYRYDNELMATTVLHEEGQAITETPFCLWTYAPEKMGTYHLNMVLRSGLLEEEISLVEWKGSTMFIEIRNSAPEATGQSGNRGTFVYLPQMSTVYEIIDLRSWFCDRDEQELSFFLSDGRKVKNGLIALGNPEAVGDLPEDTEWIEVDEPREISYAVYAKDEIGKRSDMVELTWSFVDAREGFSEPEIKGNLLKGSETQISVTYTVPAEAVNAEEAEKYIRSCVYTLAGCSVAPDENNVLKATVEMSKEKVQDYQAVLTLNGEEIRSVTYSMVNEPLEILDVHRQKNIRTDGWGRDAQFEIQLSDYIRMEDCDILSIGIESQGSSFAVAAEDGQINLTQADTEKAQGEQPVLCGFGKDSRICVRIGNLNGIYRQNGTIIMNVTDQDGSSVSVDIRYSVENARYKLVFFVLLAVLIGGLAVCVALVLQRARRNARKGLTYRLTLRYEGKEISGDADASDWHGNPVTLKQLMLLAALPPMSIETIKKAEKYTVYSVGERFVASWDKGKKESAERSFSSESTLRISVVSNGKH